MKSTFTPIPQPLIDARLASPYRQALSSLHIGVAMVSMGGDRLTDHFHACTPAQQREIGGYVQEIESLRLQLKAALEAADADLEQLIHGAGQ